MTRTQFDRHFLYYRASLCRLARYLCRSDEEADDLVQQTCLNAIEAFQDLKKEGSIRLWLRSILYNCFYAMKRNREEVQLSRKGFRLLVMDYDPPDYRYTPSFTVCSRERTRQVRAMLACIPSRFRRPFLLREYHDLSYRDIAGREGIPIGTVRSRINRARRHARSILNQEKMCFEDDRDPSRTVGIQYTGAPYR